MMRSLLFVAWAVAMMTPIWGRLPADLCGPTTEDAQDLMTEAYRTHTKGRWTGHEAYVLSTEPKGNFPDLIGPGFGVGIRCLNSRIYAAYAYA